MDVRFGFSGSGQQPEGLVAPEVFRAIATRAEELGYDSLWTTDHISFKNPIIEGMVALSAFAGYTRRIALGTGVLLLPLRHPSLVAKQVASLDYLSGGRVILGIGVGGEGDKDFAAVQVPIQERGARTNEAIAVLHRLWATPEASFDGRFFRFEGVTIAPPPAQPGGPPIWVGGRSEAALRRTGRLCDGWLAYMTSAERFTEDFAKIREYAREADRDPDEITPAIVASTYLDDDGQRAREQTQAHLSHRYARPFLPHHIERYCVAGTRDECLARLKTYIDAGVRHLVLSPAGPAATLVEQCERLYHDLIVPLRSE